MAVDEGAIEGEELLQGRDGLRARRSVGGGVREIVDAQELIGLAAVDGAVKGATVVVLGVEVFGFAADGEVKLATGVEPTSTVLEELKSLEVHKYHLSAEVADIRAFIEQRAG